MGAFQMRNFRKKASKHKLQLITTKIFFFLNKKKDIPYVVNYVEDFYTVKKFPETINSADIK